jgi:hypothetical protein
MQRFQNNTNRLASPQAHQMIMQILGISLLEQAYKKIKINKQINKWNKPTTKAQEALLWAH